MKLISHIEVYYYRYVDRDMYTRTDECLADFDAINPRMICWIKENSKGWTDFGMNGSAYFVKMSKIDFLREIENV